VLEQLVEGVGHVDGEHAPRPAHLHAHDGAEGRRVQVEHAGTAGHRPDGHPRHGDPEGPRVGLHERRDDPCVHLPGKHLGGEVVARSRRLEQRPDRQARRGQPVEPLADAARDQQDPERAVAAPRGRPQELRERRAARLGVVEHQERGGAVGDGGQGGGLGAVGHVEAGPAGVRHLVCGLAGEAGLPDAARARDQPDRHRLRACAPVEERRELGGPPHERHDASGRREQPPGGQRVRGRRAWW
jgi:hypothetical protein